MDISVALNKWASEQRKKFTEKERKAINMAIGNLYNSQRIEGITWGECIKVIKKALEKVHIDEVWVDIQSDEVCEKKPEGYMDENLIMTQKIRKARNKFGMNLFGKIM